MCHVPCAERRVQSAECRVQSAECRVQSLMPVPSPKGSHVGRPGRAGQAKAGQGRWQTDHGPCARNGGPGEEMNLVAMRLAKGQRAKRATGQMQWTNGLHHAPGHAPLWACPISDGAPRSARQREGEGRGGAGSWEKGNRWAWTHMESWNHGCSWMHMDAPMHRPGRELDGDGWSWSCCYCCAGTIRCKGDQETSGHASREPGRRCASPLVDSPASLGSWVAG
jgi:hypothetical protein